MREIFLIVHNVRVFVFQSLIQQLVRFLFNEKHDKILLIKQYDMAEHILLAGYVSNDIHNQFLQSLKAINFSLSYYGYG